MRSGTREGTDALAFDREPAYAQLRVDDWYANDTEPEISERITLIEFLWMGLRGAQPVILVSREWLQ